MVIYRILEGEKMNKKQLLLKISKASQLTLKDAESILNTFIEVITENLAKQTKIQLIGFGSFTAVKRAARVGRNPKTGEEISIPATIMPKFIPGKLLKGAVRTKAKKKK